MTYLQSICVVVEDELSGAVMRKLIATTGRNFMVDRMVNARGNGQIKSGVEKFRTSSYTLPHVVLTDLDNYPCPPALLDNWGATNLPPQLLFRIAVHEVEAWLLADREGIAEFLHVAISKVPHAPEAEIDPKRTLLNLARRSRKKRLAQELVPALGSAAQIGPLYNVRLCEFVNDKWNIEQAKLIADSLSRTLNRLNDFLPD
jgi:hypothetical protein